MKKDIHEFGIPELILKESMYKRVNVLPSMDSLVPCNGCDDMAVNGITLHVPL